MARPIRWCGPIGAASLPAVTGLPDRIPGRPEYHVLCGLITSRHAPRHLHAQNMSLCMPGRPVVIASPDRVS